MSTVVIYSVWFGYIARLSHWGGEEEVLPMVVSIPAFAAASGWGGVWLGVVGGTLIGLLAM
jgi:hypothetical protein